MNYIDKKLKEMKKHLGSKTTKDNVNREKRWTKQIIEKGWADYETWSLDAYLAPYIVERLKVFKKKNNGYPNGLTEKSWNDNLDKMILSFELSSKGLWDMNKKDYEKVKIGLELFAKHYNDLWW